MKILSALILVKMDDEKVRQVDISSDDVKMMLFFHQQRTGENIDIIEKPLEGLEFIELKANQKQ